MKASPPVMADLTPRGSPPTGAGQGPSSGSTLDRLAMNRWLQLFLTIIAGTVVAAIVWTVIERFLHIIILLIASMLIAYLLNPLASRLERAHINRGLAVLVIYVVIVGAFAGLFLIVVPPLTNQLKGLLDRVPTLLAHPDSSALNRALASHGIKLPISNLGARIASTISSAGTLVLNSTLSVVTGVVQAATDILLVFAITFYLVLDGRGMLNRAARLLPPAGRERWFFAEATLNQVLGGYLRGQLIVALTVGVAAGVGSAVLGVNYPLVIGVLAFVFELIPMIGPVLGSIPALLIALFQSPSPVVWVALYFLILQQVESNVIVPRVSGHAVGLHPLAALLALLVGVELGGIGAAFLAVPLGGVLWVVLVTLYADSTGQTQTLLTRRAPLSYSTVARRVIHRGRAVGTAPTPGAATGPGDVPADLSAPVPVRNERLETIKHEQEHLIERFEADEIEQASVEQAASPRPKGPDDTKATNVL